MGTLSFDLSITTISQFYETPLKDEVIVMDEYDQIVTRHAFHVAASGISGLWAFANRRMYAFSASSNRGVERIMYNVVERPQVLSFKSEYELIHGISAVEEKRSGRAGTRMRCWRRD